MDLNRKTNNSNINIRYILVMIIAFLNVFLFLVVLKAPDWSLSFFDFVGQWQLTAYTLQGIDPYPLIGLELPRISSIGSIPKGWGTSPWGLLLGNIFYPGFMSLDNAKIYFILINIVLLCVTALYISIKLRQLSKRLSNYVLLCSLFSFWFLFSLSQGNAGCGICCLLLLAFFCYDTHPVLAGLLLGVTLIKPQISLIACIEFLFLKNYKVVLVSFAVAGLSLLVVSGLIHNTPYNLMNEFLNAGIGGNINYSGIFTLLFIGKPFMAMIFSMISGVVFVSILIRFLPTKIYKPFCLFPACIAATFWSYSFYNDFYVLLLPLIVSIYSILYVNNKWLSVVSSFGAIYLSVVSFIMFNYSFLFYELLNFINISVRPANIWSLDRWFERNLFEAGLICWAFLQCYLLKQVNYYKDLKS